jgi:hypothetical protein
VVTMETAIWVNVLSIVQRIAQKSLKIAILSHFSVTSRLALITQIVKVNSVSTPYVPFVRLTTNVSPTEI